MSRRWSIAPHDRGVVSRISQEMRCSPLLAQVLASRGLNSAVAAKSFLESKMTDLHSPDLLPGIPEAAERIVKALKDNRRITIYGDYDVDGVTSTSILWHCLKLAGANVDYYIPCRMEEGYGLNLEAIRKLSEEDPQRLLVTVDCGICSVKEADLARDLGLELIITDHHTMLDELPRAACLVHPRLPGGSYPFGDLCGAGVAFKLAWAICQRLNDGKTASPSMREFLKGAVGLAAIGTVADVVPLVGENRIIVRYGLSTLINSDKAKDKTTPDRISPGLEMMLKVCGLDGKKQITAEDIGFGIAPRINAAGRLGQARLAVELLTTNNRQRAAQLADYLNQLNENRKSVERKMMKEAKQMVEDHPEWNDHAALVLAHADWHPGVIGILASRIAEAYERPAIMIALNEAERLGQGSARTYNGIDLHSSLTDCAEHLVTYGGHKAAAGLRVQMDKIDAFREDFVQRIATVKTEADAGAELRIDAEVVLNDLTFTAVRELDGLGPFGSEHRKPIFAATRCELVEPPKKIGGGERHLSLKVRQFNKVMKVIAFGKADWADQIAATQGHISLCFSPGLNSFNGYESVDLHLIDWQPDTVAAPIPIAV
jgi:single-stranded-DNA-specific exonuclease